MIITENQSTALMVLRLDGGQTEGGQNRDIPAVLVTGWFLPNACSGKPAAGSTADTPPAAEYAAVFPDDAMRTPPRLQTATQAMQTTADIGS
jgi:hypothetical protein